MSWRDDRRGTTPPSNGTPVRKINGPLGDLWKKRNKPNQPQHERSHPYSDALGMEEHTVFEHGPWIDMCRHVGMAVTEGQVNGGVDLGRLPINTEQVSAGYQSTGVIEQDFLLLIRSSRYVDEEIVATFHDPLGCIDGYFHRDVVDAVGAALVKNAAVLLRNVTVFMPVERRQQYLNICRSNVVRVFPSTSEYADDVAVFNANQAATLERGAFVLEDPAGEATTSADLVAMTQRHVIHQSHAQRAPPSTASKGKQKWAWKSFVPKKKKPTQHLQDHEPNPQPSPSTSESPRSPPVPAPAKQPRRMPTLAPPPANQAISMPSTASHFSIPPVHPSSFPIESRSSTSTMTPDALSLAVDQVLNDDDW